MGCILSKLVLYLHIAERWWDPCLKTFISKSFIFVPSILYWGTIRCINSSEVISCHPSNVNTLANSELYFLIISRTPNRLKPWAICSIMTIFGPRKLFSNRDLQARIGNIIIWLTFLRLKKWSPIWLLKTCKILLSCSLPCTSACDSELHFMYHRKNFTTEGHLSFLSCWGSTKHSIQCNLQTWQEQLQKCFWSWINWLWRTE